MNVVSLGSEGNQLLRLYLVYTLNTSKEVRLVRTVLEKLCLGYKCPYL